VGVHDTFLSDGVGEALQHVEVVLESIDFLLDDSLDVFELDKSCVGHLYEHVHHGLLVFSLSTDLLEQVVVGDTALHYFFLVDVEVALVSFKLLAKVFSSFEDSLFDSCSFAGPLLPGFESLFVF